MVSFHNVLRRVWSRKHNTLEMEALFCLLFVLSLPYAIVTRFRNLLYDWGVFRQEKLSCKVISIGNVTAGGTGKTPAVMMVAKILQENGYRPAVLSRGYGGKGKRSTNIVSDGQNIFAEYHEAGDEPLLLAQRLKGVPVITGSRRSLAGERAIREFRADVLILDDGFQHRGLYRDMDIVLLDQSEPFGNGRLLPCGALREAPKAVRRADVVILTGSNQHLKEEIPPPLQSFLNDGSHLFRAYHRPLDIMNGGGGSVPPESLKGKRIFAFAGIGNPDSFCKTIDSLGASLAGFFPFPDHHRFNGDDVRSLQNLARRHRAEVILTTEKDAMRLGHFPEYLQEISILRIEMTLVSNEYGAFRSLILQRLKV